MAIIKDISYDQRKAWAQTLHPKTVVWEVTLQCNMRCIHCGSSASPLTKRKDELSIKEAIDLIHQLKGINTERVILAGGEPFLRKDWDILANEIASVGMTPALISNGFLINKDVVDRIKKVKHPKVHVGLSVDGDEKTHDYIRQRKGSFKHMTEAMKMFKEKGVLFSVITQVNQVNFKILPKIRDHIFKYGIYAWQLQLGTPWGRLAKDPKLLLSPADYVEFVKFIVEQKSIFGDMVVGADDIGYYTELEPKLRTKTVWRGCHAGLAVLGVTSNGGITGCLSLQAPQFIEGNIREKKLSDIWFDPDKFSYNRNFKEQDLKGYCAECMHRLKCRGGCKNLAYSFTGSLGENYYCVFRIMLGKSPKNVKLPKRNADCNLYHP